ncbi:hypothetical protein L5D93_10360 [Paenibacillus thiaminolyticus]|nr:hypothetical protein [Paenibacillus thiaminolyticus]
MIIYSFSMRSTAEVKFDAAPQSILKNKPSELPGRDADVTADIAHRGAFFMLQAYICSYDEAVIDVSSQHIEMEERGHEWPME